MTTPPAYSTALGSAFQGDTRDLLQELDDESVNLVFTSPPFALQRQKEYGNPDESEYVDWLIEFGAIVKKKLRGDGSFVLDLGGAYQKGVPSRSLYPFRVVTRFCDELGFVLAEDFYWFNPSKLPSPIEWVNKRKLRAKDAVNAIWWFSKTAWPKANITNVLAPYSDRMKKLIADPAAFYTPKKRPSGHDIASAFGKNNSGAIPANLLQIPNSESSGRYLNGCATVGVTGHPARFPAKLPEFFIKFLTDAGDLVLDIFAGSNTTGAVAEQLGRRWIAFELDLGYLATSAFRFTPPDESEEKLQEIYRRVLHREPVDLREPRTQLSLLEVPGTNYASKPARKRRKF
jgi:site-specific DNA-methyltransferase (cytosine-N4-specific)